MTPEEVVQAVESMAHAVPDGDELLTLAQDVWTLAGSAFWSAIASRVGVDTRWAKYRNSEVAAQAIITGLLSDGPRDEAAILRLADAAGIDRHDLADVRKRMGVSIVRSKTGSVWVPPVRRPDPLDDAAEREANAQERLIQFCTRE